VSERKIGVLVFDHKYNETGEYDNLENFIDMLRSIVKTQARLMSSKDALDIQSYLHDVDIYELRDGEIHKLSADNFHLDFDVRITYEDGL